jgi:hypothetical protein
MRVSSSVHQPAGARHVRAPPRRAAPPPPRAGSNGNGASGPAPSPHPAQLLSYLGGAPAATLEPQANGKARPAKGDEAAAQQQAPAGGASKTTLLPVYAPDEVFVCPEESSCYSQALEKLVFGRCGQGRAGGGAAVTGGPRLAGAAVAVGGGPSGAGEPRAPLGGGNRHAD